MCGTLDYLPPEIVQQQEYDHNVDIWCLGVLMYEFLDGNPPFADESMTKTQQRIVKVDLNFPAHFSHDARALLSELLVKDPSKRLPLAKLVEHPWIVKNATKCSDY